MKSSPDLTLNIQMYASSSGGRKGPTPPNRFKCILKVMNELHDCLLILDKNGPLLPGKNATVDVVLLMPDLLKDRLKKGQEIYLCEGSKEIAKGDIKRTHFNLKETG